MSTPPLGIIYGFANRHDARDPASQVVPTAGQLAHRPRLIA
ncbi:hypothetical protein [Mycobacterium paraffinicum]|nr:hypothetical protein [Mycobacterium paraffinicum]